MASPTFKINGAATSTSIAVGAGGAVSATLDSTVGVRSCTWSIVRTDDTTAPAGYVLHPAGALGQTVTTTALAAGTAAILQCMINGGLDPATDEPSAAMTATGKFYVATTSGREVLCAGEQGDANVESSASHGIIRPLNDTIRMALGNVTAAVDGTVNAFGATNGTLLGSDGATAGGVWRDEITITPANIVFNEDVSFSSTHPSPTLTQVPPLPDVAAAVMYVRAQTGGEADAGAGKAGGQLAIRGGIGGEGTAALAAGAGSIVSIVGGAAGINNGGGGADGGGVQIGSGTPSGAGVYKAIQVGYPRAAEVQLGNATDNPPITQVGTGVVTLVGPVKLDAAAAATGDVRVGTAFELTGLVGAADVKLVSTFAAGSGVMIGELANMGSVYMDASTEVKIRVGGAQRMYVSPTIAEFDVPDVYFGKAVAAPKLYQEDGTVAGESGDALLIHSQDETGGGASVGGDLRLRPGHGTTHGMLDLQDAEATTRLRVTDTGTIWALSPDGCAHLIS